eukprot:gb/GECH01009354.1/.p1 GENE.gb/GECH01009354.1/~~gb/GECH01009354.1/.p1  ORF type:complete len:160 (+),score=7.07 gb/GECH01009354.1/:1-480(+)
MGMFPFLCRTLDWQSKYEGIHFFVSVTTAHTQTFLINVCLVGGTLDAHNDNYRLSLLYSLDLHLRFKVKDLKGKKLLIETTSLAKKALYMASYPETIKNGFKYCGMWPMDLNLLLQNHAICQTEEESEACKKEKHLRLDGIILNTDNVIENLKSIQGDE